MAIGGSSNDVEIKVRVDSQGANKAFDDLNRKLDDTEKQTKKAKISFTELNQAIELGQKAFNLLSGAISSAFNAIERGSAVDDVAQAFERLSEAAGATSKVFLNDLQKATAGTISNFDLLSKANKALRAGLTPDQFTDINKAARVLAEDGLGALEENIDSLTSAFARGRTARLKDLKIYIDEDEAARKFSNGLVQKIDLLNEEGRVLAIQNAIAEKYNQLAAESSRLTEDAGDKVGQLRAALTNAKDEFFQAAANNADLNQALSELVNWINSIDFQRLISQLGQVITLVRQTGEVVSEVFGGGASAINSWTDDLVEWAYSFTSTGKQLEDLKKKVGENIDLLKTGETTTKAVTKAEEEHASAIKKTTQAASQTNRFKKEYLDQTKKETKETLSAAQAQIKLQNETKTLINAFKNGAISAALLKSELDKLQTSLKGTGVDAKTAAGIIDNELTKAADGIGETLDKAAESADDAFQQLSDSITGSIFSGLADALSGNLEDALGNTLSGIGGALGAYTGIPGLDQLGAVIGQKLGDAITDAIESVLGGRDAEGAVRDSLDALFAGYFEDNPFQQLIEGALQSVNDLEFGRGTDIFNTGTFDDLLLSLDQELQRAFQAAGLAFSTFVEGGIELSGQLAAILTNNVGGSLNNLQVLIEATGVSFEELHNQVVEAFLDGELTIQQAAEALLGLEQLAAAGIPDAIGDVAQAFNNLQIALQDSSKGGRFTVDAIRDVAAEAQELGIKTLPQLANALVNTFGFGAAEVQAFMQALAASGIETLEELVNASAAAGIQIAANTQAALEGRDPIYTSGESVSTSTPSSYSPSGGGGGSSASSRAADNSKRNREQARAALNRLVEGTQDYKAAITSLNAGLIDEAQAFNIINNLYDRGRELTKELTKAQKAFDKHITEKTTKNLLAAKKALDEFTGAGSPKNATINEGLLNFAKKFSDNIDLINVAAQRAGISFAQLKDNAIQAFLAGKSSIAEAVAAVNDAGPGIAGVKGGVSQAFESLKGFGKKGGALSVDALRDIAAEAIELGGKNLEELQSSAVAQGVDPKSLQSLISVLQAQGINSLEQLVNASDETAIRILGGLDELAFPFEQTSDAVLQLLDDLNKIPDSKSVDLVLNLKTGAIDERLVSLLESLGIDIPEVLPGYGSSGDAPGISQGGKSKKKKKKKK